MIVLSLFDGISCGQLALQRAGIPIEYYFASEIDKYAIQVTQKNFPNTIQIGDVTKIDWIPFKEKVDLLIGGSPCQDLSIAKRNRQELKGERSSLFFNYLDALQIIKPRYFLLENVASMSKEAKSMITKLLGVEPIMINSALVSAQQRKRLYWTNIPNVTQPKDKGIFLQNILEDGLVIRGEKKSNCITSSVQRTTPSMYFERFQNSLKAYCLDSNYWKGSSLEYMLEKHKREQIAVPVDFKKNQTNKVYSVIDGYIYLNTNVQNDETEFNRYKVNLPNGTYVIRKLTPVECERLQTLPDNYTSGISNTQRYKCIGNGWTVDVITHILKEMK